jgi:predicted permease
VKPLEETHGGQFELVRHFLARTFDSEMISTRGSWGTVAVGAFALAVPLGMLMLSKAPHHYKTPEAIRASAMAGALSNMTLLLAITGILALLAWQSLFPSRRDYLALAGLPVRSRQIFFARFACMALIAGVVTFTIGSGPSLSGPRPLARMTATWMGSVCVFFTIVTVQGVLVHVLPPRLFARWSTLVQGIFIAVCLVSGLYSWSIRDWPPEVVARLRDFGGPAPPVWFFGLEQTLSGSRDPFFAAMGRRATSTALASVACAVLVYLAAYARHRKLLLETQDMAAPRSVLGWSWLGMLAREPRRQAILHFLATVLSRSRLHRLVVMAYAGAGLALMVNALLLAGRVNTLRFIALYWPLGFSIVVLAGVRHAFLMPVDLPANWIFRLLEGQGRREWMSAVERFVVGVAIVPIHLAGLAVAVNALGWAVALRMAALQLVTALLVFEFLFYSWQQLPFTCSYAPGRNSLIASLAGWLALLCFVVPLHAQFIAGASHMPVVFFLYAAPFVAAWLWARRRRREGWGEAKLIYEDPQEAVADLGIKDLAYHGEAWELDTSVVASPNGLETTRPIARSLRLYRALAAAFPHEFRSAYGDEMVHAAEESIESVWRRHGSLGLIRLLLDITIRLPAEYLTEVGRDLRYGVRMLARSPGFTAVAIISLTLGIGVATSAFSEMNGFILHDVPGVSRPGDLVLVQAPVSYPAYKRFRERTDLFSSLTAYMAPVPFGVRVGTRTERIWGHLVSPAYFATLGVRPFLGGTIDEPRERPGQAPSVVISYRFWQDHLGANPSIVGQMLRVNGYACEVIGIGPKDFLGASPMIYQADLWMPAWTDTRAAPELDGNVLEQPDTKNFHVLARLAPGIPAGRAEAALDAITRQLEVDTGEQERNQGGRRVALLPGGKMMPVPKQDLPFLTGFFTILGGMILLIASSNMANMMLARAADRRKEIAVRLALGASRFRLIRQLLTECMILAAVSGVSGFLMTVWLMRSASQMKMPNAVPMLFNLQPDGRVLLFTFCLTAFTGLAFGLAPALQATRADLTPALKEGGNVRLEKFRRLSLRNLLVVSQVAGSLTLLLITGFLVIGHRRMAEAQTGFESRNLYLLSIDPLRDGYSAAQTTAFFRNLLDRAKRIPGINTASLADTTPMQMIDKPAITYAVDSANGGQDIHGARRSIVAKEYFDTLGIPILHGRGFTTADEGNDSIAAIVNERVVRDCWKSGNPLGQRLEIGSGGLPGFHLPSPKRAGGGERPRLTGATRVVEVVGVVKNVRDGLDMAAKELPPIIYVPLRPAEYARPNIFGVTLMVRAAPGFDAIGAVQREIAAIDTNLTPYRARTMDEQIEDLTSPVTSAMWTYGFIGIFGLILASVGLAGVTAYSVSRRRREIGIRMALGARRADVLGLVMREGAVLVAVGTVMGLAGARAGTRVLAAFMSEVARTAGTSTSDPMLMIGAPLLLAFLAMLACFVPARKSMRIDPAVALRSE